MQPESTIPTAEQIRVGRDIVEKELDAASRAHEGAAFKAANSPGDETARAALREARARVGLLESELEGLDAVGREAARRRSLAAIDAKLGELDALEASAQSGFKAFDAALADVYAAIDGLGERLAALDAAENLIRAAEYEAYAPAARVGGNALPQCSSRALVEETMQQALPAVIDYRNAHQRTREQIQAIQTEMLRRARAQFAHNLESQRAGLRAKREQT